MCEVDELERVVAAMTPAPWHMSTRNAGGIDSGGGTGDGAAPACPVAFAVAIPPDPEPGVFWFHNDSDAVVALRNAAPALIARVRELEAVIRRILDTEHGSGAEHDAMCDARALIAHDLKPIDKETDRG